MDPHKMSPLKEEPQRGVQNIVIVGSSGHAKVIIDMVEQEGRYRIIGTLDRDRPVGQETLGYPVLGRQEDLPQLMKRHDLHGAIVAIGDNFVRSRVVDRVLELCPGLPFVSAIHPRATIGKAVSVGVGTVIMAGAVVNPCCSIGRFCILNTNSSLDHDSWMGDYSSLAPAASTGGNCRIGGYSAVGIGAIIKHGVQIGEHTVIGAGSTVLRNQESCRVVYGTPAKQVRTRNPGDKYL